MGTLKLQRIGIYPWRTELPLKLVRFDGNTTVIPQGSDHSPCRSMVFLYQPRIFIPDLLARWPYIRGINPHHVMVAEESDTWTISLGAFSPKAQHAFSLADFSLLSCLAYPKASKEHLRTCCDFMNMVFVIDEHSDAAEPSEARKQRDIVMDAFRNPYKPRPKGEWVGGEMTRQFWELAIQNASEQSQKRFIAAFEKLLQGMLQQAIDRSEHHIRDIGSYFDLRRVTIGARPAFALLELGLKIPDEVISHPVIEKMTLAAIDMISIANDVGSYNVEQYRGEDDHNLVTIVMKELGTDVNGAMLYAQDLHTKAEQEFHAAMEVLPEWDEPLNSQVKEYCHGLGDWVRANYDWIFESERYFGSRGMEIRANRWMFLMPRCKKAEPVGPVLVDSSLL